MMFERKTISKWASLDGVKIHDPDGFDRTDPKLWEKKITKQEYLSGIWRCTIAFGKEREQNDQQR